MFPVLHGTIVCRLVEEVRESCEVDITNDDVFMNTRYVHLWSGVYVTCLCITGMCLVKSVINLYW